MSDEQDDSTRGDTLGERLVASVVHGLDARDAFVADTSERIAEDLIDDEHEVWVQEQRDMILATIGRSGEVDTLDEAVALALAANYDVHISISDRGEQELLRDE